MKIYLLTFCGSLYLISVSASIITIPATYSTIQTGIDNASNGDTVLVQPGVYFENINYHGKNVVVTSLYILTGDMSYISQTVINGNNNIASMDGSVVTFENSETAAAQLSGFTLTGGTGDARFLGNYTITYGGGIFCNGASPTLSHLLISGNNCECGGGVCLYNSNSLIEYCGITENTCISMEFSAPDAGGGIVFWNCQSPRLLNSKVMYNVVDYAGAGIYFLNSSPKIVNCLISKNNSYSFASTFYLDAFSNVDVINSTIAGNIADTSASIANMIYCLDSTALNFSNCILWNNSPNKIIFQSSYPSNVITVSHTNLEGDTSSILTQNNGTINWLSGNIDTDPLFADTALNNFHLQNNSPSINAGDSTGISNNIPVYDLDNNARYIGAIDMGCYENNTQMGITLTAFGKGLEVEIYPNPTNSILFIKRNSNSVDEIRLSLCNLSGQLISSFTLAKEESHTQFDVSAIASGIYFLEVACEGNLSHDKIAIRH